MKAPFSVGAALGCILGIGVFSGLSLVLPYVVKQVTQSVEQKPKIENWTLSKEYKEVCINGIIYIQTVGVNSPSVSPKLGKDSKYTTGVYACGED